MAKIIRLTENDLASIVRRVILENNDVTRKLIQAQFVDKEKISQEDADDILSISAKGNYLMWLAKMVANGAVQSSEIKSFDNYFKTADDAKKPGITDE